MSRVDYYYGGALGVVVAHFLLIIVFDLLWSSFEKSERFPTKDKGS